MPIDFLSKEEILEYLSELASTLNEKGIEAKIYVFGGAAMVVAFDSRPATRDVDAAYSPQEEVEAVADEIGIQHNIGIDWLNNAAVRFLPDARPDQDDLPTFVLQEGSVEIKFASAKTLLAMKVNASRERDRRDIMALCRELQIKTQGEAVEVYQAHYLKSPLSDEALELLDEIFSEERFCEPDARSNKDLPDSVKGNV